MLRGTYSGMRGARRNGRKGTLLGDHRSRRRIMGEGASRDGRCVIRGIKGYEGATRPLFFIIRSRTE